MTAIIFRKSETGKNRWEMRVYAASTQRRCAECAPPYLRASGSMTMKHLHCCCMQNAKQRIYKAVSPSNEQTPHARLTVIFWYASTSILTAPGVSPSNNVGLTLMKTLTRSATFGELLTLMRRQRRQVRDNARTCHHMRLGGRGAALHFQVAPTADRRHFCARRLLCIVSVAITFAAAPTHVVRPCRRIVVMVKHITR
jgi:hypothetical protein